MAHDAAFERRALAGETVRHGIERAAERARRDPTVRQVGGEARREPTPRAELLRASGRAPGDALAPPEAEFIAGWGRRELAADDALAGRAAPRALRGLA